MSEKLCFQCFRIKGDYDVCPWCGYTTEKTFNQAYQLKPGTILKERYIIGITLGIGGFGITYKAYDTVLSIVVAIKEFYPARLVNRGAGQTKVGIFSGDKKEEYEHFLKRFQEEAQVMAKFSKEKDVVNIFDYVEANSTAYIIMEFVDAVLLKDRLSKSGKMSVKEATEYMTAILNALSKVHYHGIVHKDISPDNIFITGSNTIKLADFGAARLQGTRSGEKTEAIVKVGYTPPEQYQPNSEQGTFMDIYAAGAVFYEMLTGEKPQDAMDRQMEDLLESPAERGIEIDPRLNRIVMKAMALKSKLRFQTAEQFKDAIVTKKNVNLPEEELRKKRLERKIIGAAAAIAATLSIIILVLSQTLFSAKGKIDIAGIKEETVEVWLPAEKEQSEEVINALTEDVKEKCPEITLEIETISPAKYGKRLEKAVQKGKMPNVFCTDYLPEESESKEYCEELSPLLNTMNMDDYLFFQKSGKTGIYDIPSAVQVGVVYISESKMKKIPDSYTKAELKTLSGSLQYTDKEDVFKEFSKKKSKITLLAGDLSAMEKVKDVTVDMIPPQDFDVVPILEKGKIIGCFKNCYGVEKSLDKNKKEASMIVLASMLSNPVQSIAYMNNEEGIPINKSVYADYTEYKMTTYLAFLKKYGEEKVNLQDGRNMCEILRR